MCIIAHAAKKRHITRDEVLECMRVNSSGFFMCALRPDGTRDTIRTLDEKEAIKFFDDKVKDEDAFVMHARIPSRGEKTLENVHGWESDGILFMHNMTITDVDAMMKRVNWTKTDSEFFFRKVFIPFYRGLGAEAYKDGKFHEDLDNIIQHFVGMSNKFLFIMPDNSVIRYGSWVSEPDRKEDGKVAFYASNSGYRVYRKTTWGGGSAVNTAGFCRGEDADEYGGLGYGYDEYDEYNEYGYCGYGEYGGYGEGRRSRRKNRAGKDKPAKKKKEFDGKTLLKLAGFKGLCQIALAHLVINNAIECRAIYSEDEKEKEKIASVLRAMLPRCMGVKNLDRIKSLIGWMLGRYDGYWSNGSDPVMAAQTAAEEFCEVAAEMYEEDIVREHCGYAILANEINVKSGLDTVVTKINLILRILNVHVDFKALEPDYFTTGFVLSKDGWSMEEFMVEDLLDIDSIEPDNTALAIRMLLAECNNDFSMLLDPEEPDDRPPAGEASDGKAAEAVAADKGASGEDDSPTLEEMDDMYRKLYGDDGDDGVDVEDAVGGTVSADDAHGEPDRKEGTA